MDDAMPMADPIVQVALMDAYFEMTGDRYYESDLERMLDSPRARGDAGEELYIAARLALGRLNGRASDTLGQWGDTGVEVRAVRTLGLAPRRRAGIPQVRAKITIIIHGTWAADGKWWRPGGDFFKYVKTELGRDDVYGERDQFKWSGRNRDASRKKAASNLNKWLHSHPAEELNIFAHSHGANVAMLVTHQGHKIDRLVMLSPPVREDYFAKWSNVAHAYNIQAKFDAVVAIARGGRWFERSNVKEKELRASGHSASHDPDVWRDERLGRFVGMPWS
jgi:hypothetical protein